MTISPPHWHAQLAVCNRSNLLKAEVSRLSTTANGLSKPVSLSIHAFALLAILILCGNFSIVQATNSRAPVLLSENTSTRALAVESVTLRAAPFGLTSSAKFGEDTRTRHLHLCDGLRSSRGGGD